MSLFAVPFHLATGSTQPYSMEDAMSRILVIDDDAEMRDMLKQTLSSAGYEVVLAKNGNQGLQLQQVQPADLVITDLLMPEKEGLETILEFRQDFPRVPVIAISGRASTGFFLHMAGRLGAVKTLEKPFQPKELLAAIEAILKTEAA